MKPEHEKFEEWCSNQIFPKSWKDDECAIVAWKASKEQAKAKDEIDNIRNNLHVLQTAFTLQTEELKKLRAESKEQFMLGVETGKAAMRESLLAAEDENVKLREEIERLDAGWNGANARDVARALEVDSLRAELAEYKNMKPVAYLNLAAWSNAGYESVFATPSRAFNNQDELFAHPKEKT